jgi:hypothetical protein
MKIIAYDCIKPGATMDAIQPLLPLEVANVWWLWKAGIVRENYARADEPGVVIVFELDNVEQAKRYGLTFRSRRQVIWNVFTSHCKLHCRSRA